MKFSFLLALAIVFLAPLNAGAQGTHCSYSPNIYRTQQYTELRRWKKALQADFIQSVTKPVRLTCNARVNSTGALSDISILPTNSLPELRLIAEKLIKKHTPETKTARAEWKPKVVRSHCYAGPRQFPPIEWLVVCVKSIRRQGFDSNYRKDLMNENIVCSFKLLKSGYVDKLRLIKRSSNKIANEAALELIRKSFPLPVYSKAIGKSFFIELEYPRLQMKLVADIESGR